MSFAAAVAAANAAYDPADRASAQASQARSRAFRKQTSLQRCQSLLQEEIVESLVDEIRHRIVGDFSIEKKQKKQFFVQNAEGQRKEEKE